jgi:protein TonB
MPNPRLLRLLLVFFVAAIHGALLLFFMIYIEPSLSDPEPPLSVMKLVDIQEEIPPPPKPPETSPPLENTVETIAEHMTVVEEVPEEQVLVDPGTLTAPVTLPVPAPEPETYLAQNKISKIPVFSEGAIRRALTYPPIAQRSGIEGSVILELFIDREGVVQRVIILKETPTGRGFGEAAAKAFQGQRCTPAESNGKPVAVRFRYPVRFSLTSP